MNSIVKSACPHCEGHLEFDASDSGREVFCPHCEAPILLLAPPTAVRLPPSPPAFYYTPPPPPRLASPLLLERPKPQRTVLFLVLLFAGCLGAFFFMAGLSTSQPEYAWMMLVLPVVGTFVYFLPAIIAENRMHPNAEAVAVLNFFLGWTFIGWVIALVWAHTNPK